MAGGAECADARLEIKGYMIAMGGEAMMDCVILHHLLLHRGQMAELAMRQYRIVSCFDQASLHLFLLAENIPGVWGLAPNQPSNHPLLP